MTTAYGGYPPDAGTGVPGLLQRLGERVNRRAEPRFGIAVAGVGMLMILIGILVWSGERVADPPGDDPGADPDTTLGIILSMLVVAAGYTLLVRFKRGPLATAGVVAAVIGIPVLLGFATYDQPDQSRFGNDEVIIDEDGGVIDDGTDFEDDDFAVDTPTLELPFNIHLIAITSVAAWLLSFVLVPGAGGRLFFLAASLFFVWLYLLELAEEGAIAWVISLPFFPFFWPFFAMAEALGGGGPEPELPDPTTIGALSLMFGLAYYAVGFALDRTGRRGLATPFTVAGLVTTGLGIGHLAGDLEQIGTGIVLILLGTVLTIYGATQGRRFTTWGWAFAIGLGVLLIVGKSFDDSAAGFGVTAVVLGAALVLLAWLLTSQIFTEPDEMEPGPSRFPPRQPAPVATAAAPWPGGGQVPMYDASGAPLPPPQPPQPPQQPPPGQPPTEPPTAPG